MKYTLTPIILSSSLRLLDCINRPENLIDRAIELGLCGISITDHEALCSHIIVNKYYNKIKEKYPYFKIGLGNEIYLCKDREKNQRYYHFILIAKNKNGYRALKELSSRAWLNSYYDRGMERTVTTYDDLREIVEKYPNSLIATTACIGSFVGSNILKYLEYEKMENLEEQKKYHNLIGEFINYCLELFGNDFYIECAPAQSKDQILVNKRLKEYADYFGIKMIIGTDAHYLKKEDRYVHKAYLNSKGGEREVDTFYEYAYLQDEKEIKENLEPSELNYDTLVRNSYELYEKIEMYSLEHTQVIPKVEVDWYGINTWWGVNNPDADDMSNYPTLKYLFTSNDNQERYWVNECWNALNEIKPWRDNLDYVKRLEIEANIIKSIGEKLNDCLFAYFNTFKHYIDLFWKCGSIVGPGRGSATGFLSNYLLGITQLDPIQWDLPYWRFLNHERAELPDVDIDLAPSKRPRILREIKKERGEKFNKDIDKISKDNLGITLVATFGTEGTRSTILTACRGYRSEEFPDGIDSDIGQYMSSLIPQERGFLWPLDDVLNGNKDKGRKPIKSFINEVNKYPGLLDIMKGIQNLVNKRSSHASGVILFDEDPYELGCFMRTPKGEVITQWDLHDAEYAGMTKYDLLVTEVSDKMIQCLELLINDGHIKPNTLRNIYNKYLHPQVIDIKNENIWKALGEGTVLDCFQFSTDVGLMAAKKLKPQDPKEMTDANALMRLMAQEKGAEPPIDKYYRFKNNYPFLWEQEMKKYGLTKAEKDNIEHIYAPAYGCPSIQEDLMILLMENANFTLAEANDARKIVAKKQMSRIPELQEKIFERISHKGFAQYIWDTGIKPQLG